MTIETKSLEKIIGNMNLNVAKPISYNLDRLNATVKHICAHPEFDSKDISRYCQIARNVYNCYLNTLKIYNKTKAQTNKEVNNIRAINKKENDIKEKLKPVNFETEIY